MRRGCIERGARIQMITDLAGLLRLQRRPGRWQGRRGAAGGVFDIDQCTRAEPAAAARGARPRVAADPSQTGDPGTPGQSRAPPRQGTPAHRRARRARPPRPTASRRARSSRAAVTSRSTNVACAAPRDSASSPSAPLPANRSRQRAPCARVPSQLNSVSRTRSGVGRSPSLAGKRSLRPRQLPPMMRRTRAWPARLTGAATPTPDLSRNAT